MSKNLKSCPFCGGEAEIVGGPENWTPTFYDPDSGGDSIQINCKECGCILGYFDDYDDAFTVWNRRYSEPLTQPEPCEDNYPGLKVKYRVYKALNNEPVENCFVLRPDKDNAARPALEMYAECCDNEILRRDIRLWLMDLMTRQPSSQPAKTARIIDDTPHPFSAGSERYVCSACGVRVKRGDGKCSGCGAVFEEDNDD